jgi:tetratricopeptide (TPR) repeat protein
MAYMENKLNLVDINQISMRLKSISVLFIVLFFVAGGKAQSREQAFSKSYLFEYENQYDRAIKALNDEGAETYEVNLRLGWLYYLSKDYIKSESSYRKAISMEPLSVEGRFGLALPLSAMGNWNGVLAAYLDILRQDPNNSIANYRTASIYYNRKDYNNASSYVFKVIRMYPFDYESNLLYGRVLMAQSKNTEARKYLERALEYNPQSEDARSLIKKL